MQMTNESLGTIEAYATSAPIWMLNYYIKLVRNGLEGVTAEVKAHANDLLLKLNRLAEHEAVPQIAVGVQPTYLEPALALPDVFSHRKAA